MTKNNTSSELSGISIGAGILVTGFILAFWFENALGPVTFWVAAICLGVGVIGSVIETAKLINTNILGLDNLGLGIVILTICYLLLSNSDGWNPWIKYSVNSLAVIFLILAISGISDGVYKTGKVMFAKKT